MRCFKPCSWIVAVLALTDAIVVRGASITVPGTYSSPYSSTITLVTGDDPSILVDGTATGSPAMVVSSTGVVGVDNAGLINSGTGASTYGIQIQRGRSRAAS